MYSASRDADPAGGQLDDAEHRDDGVDRDQLDEGDRVAVDPHRAHRHEQDEERRDVARDDHGGQRAPPRAQQLQRVGAEAQDGVRHGVRWALVDQAVPPGADALRPAPERHREALAAQHQADQRQPHHGDAQPQQGDPPRVAADLVLEGQQGHGDDRGEQRHAPVRQAVHHRGATEVLGADAVLAVEVEARGGARRAGHRAGDGRGGSVGELRPPQPEPGDEQRVGHRLEHLERDEQQRQDQDVPPVQRGEGRPDVLVAGERRDEHAEDEVEQHPGERPAGDRPEPALVRLGDGRLVGGSRCAFESVGGHRHPPRQGTAPRRPTLCGDGPARLTREG